MNIESMITNLISDIRINDILDILITTFVIYKILEFIKETRAQQLLKGLLVLVATYFISDFLDLQVIHWFLGATFTVGLFALVVIFQPELRRGLEVIGRSKLTKGRIRQVEEDDARRIIQEIVEAVGQFSATKTGALIIFEREISLQDIIEKGTLINGRISAQLLGNLFYEGSPLHDGAVIIRGSKVCAAGCVLPLSENPELNKSLGTRHRAGIGITENSDAVALIVSEETGIISVARDARITRFMERRNVEKMLTELYMNDLPRLSGPFGRIGKRLGKRGKHATK